jgi:hypothetical protein
VEKSESAEEPKHLLTREEIFAAEDSQHVDVLIPEWSKPDRKCYVRLRSLTAAEAIAFAEETAASGENLRKSAVRIVLLTAVDDNNKEVFTKDDLEGIKGKNFKAILRLQDAALRLNGIAATAFASLKND